MAKRVTVILDTGGFFPREQKDQPFIDVGYFETPVAWDIEVTEEDGNGVLATHADTKLGRGNQRIDVKHVDKAGNVQGPVNRTESFTRDILNKDDLYEIADMPDFIPAAYDCIFRFHSGEFVSADVRDRRFTVHSVSDNSVIGEKWTRKPIANEIHAHYDLTDGDQLRFSRDDGSLLWSSNSANPGSTIVKVKIMAHQVRNRDYHKRALAHKAEHYYMPNSDPPPQNGPNGG